MDRVTLLVGHVYECDNKHEVLAYHPDIIKQIPGSFIPFKLWHITGFTVECIELVVALMSAGMSVNYVKTVIEQKQLSFFYTQKMHLHGNNTFQPLYHLIMLYHPASLLNFGRRRVYTYTVYARHYCG